MNQRAMEDHKKRFEDAEREMIQDDVNAKVIFFLII